MSSAEAEGPAVRSVRTVLAILAVTFLALVALWFCVRATVLQLTQEEYPLVGQAMGPPSPVSLALISLNRASARNGIADPLARELSARALRRAPLLADPFIVAGLDASARDDFDRAERLMEEAKRRNPRAIIPRYWLFDSYLRRGDYARGVAEAGPLVRLQPAAEPAAVAVLTALLPVAEARPALVSALRNRPPWRRAFFQQAAASPRLRNQAAALLDVVEPNGQSTARGEQQAVLRAMIKAKDYAGAYAFWLGTLPPDQRPASPGLYDGGFASRAGGPPFGWRFPRVQGAVQVVPAQDAASGSGLAIRIGSGRPALLAEQLVLATPRPVRLDFSVRGSDADIGDTGLKLELRCAANRKVLATTVVEDFTPALRQHRLIATVPDGCGAVQVRIVSAPGIEAHPLNALLTDMALSFG